MAAIQAVSIDPRALVETDAVGSSTDVNCFAHIMASAVIGKNCNICPFATIDEGVVLEDDILVMNGAYVAKGVYLKQGVFIGPNAVIANDRRPRSPRSPLARKRYALESNWLVATVIGEYASIGANATIGGGMHVGAYAMVGAGAVVTRPVPAYALVVGNPARIVGWVDERGEPRDKPPEE